MCSVARDGPQPSKLTLPSGLDALLLKTSLLPPGLHQVFTVLFLPGAASREVMARPTQASIDMRGACFCHRRSIDVGFVCSVCLSVFCEFKPICGTCGARVALRAAGRGVGRGRGAALRGRGASTAGAGVPAGASASASAGAGGVTS